MNDINKLHHKIYGNPCISFWKNRKNVLFSAAILLISFIVYLPSLQNGFVNWDDSVYIYKNFYILNIESWGDIVKYAKGIFTTTVNSSYKPLVILSFAFEKVLFGLDNPTWWHLNNIILHLVCVLLVFRISLALELKVIPAVFCALLFGIHPMRVESVAWLTERKDVLYGTFYLLALYYYIKSVKLSFRKRYLLIILTSFSLSLLAKIQAVALPLSMLLVDYYFGRKLSIRLIIEKWHFFLLSLIRGIAGIYFLTQVETILDISNTMPFLTRLFVGFYTYIVYVLKSVVPYEMVPIYPYPATFGLKFYLSILPLIFIVAITYHLYRKENKTGVFGVLFFSFNIMFLLQIIGSGQGYLADRYTYIAYFGLFLIYAYCFQLVLEKYGRFANVFYAAAVTILCLLGYANFQQNKIWKNGETLWSHQLKSYTSFSRAWDKRAEYYQEKGEFEKALYDYNKAIAINPKPTHFNGRGLIYLKSNERPRLILAVKEFSKAIELSTKISVYAMYTGNYYINRGIAYTKLSMLDKALQDFHQAFLLNPLNNDIFYNRSKVYISQERYDKAQEDLETYVRLNPYYAYMWANLGEVRRLNKQYDKALDAFNEAIAIDLDNLSVFYFRMKTYFEMGSNDLARKELDFLQSKGFQNISPDYERMLKGKN